MAVNTHGSGSQTAVIGTEHSLTTGAVAGVYELLIDTVNMAAGDVVELRIKQRVLTGGTVRVVQYQSYAGAQPTDDLIKVSLPVSNDLVEAGAVDFTLKQTAGTGRAFPWKVVRHS